MNIASLPGVGITSEICLLTAILADKDNPSSEPSSDAVIRNSQETFAERRQVRSRMACRVSTLHACSVSKSHHQNTNIKCNARDVMRLYQSLGSEVSIPPR